MNKKLSIKGLANKDCLKDKYLQSMSIHVINGTINSTYNLEDLFEIYIDSSILDKSSIEFRDMNLNTFNLQFIFNIIGINDSDKGEFFKFTHNCTITYKSFINIEYYNLIILDGFFYNKSNSEISFSLITALDFSKENPLMKPQINPNYTNKDLLNSKIDILFDKEFI